jgi:hypothetical protein
VNWWEFKPVQVQEYDGSALLEKVRKQINAAIKKAQENDDTATVELLTAMLG